MEQYTPNYNYPPLPPTEMIPVGVPLPNQNQQQAFQISMINRPPLYPLSIESHNSTYVQCPACNNAIFTIVKHRNTIYTYLMSLLLIFSFFCCLCFWIPFTSDHCKRVEHYCPKCNYKVSKNECLYN